MKKRFAYLIPLLFLATACSTAFVEDAENDTTTPEKAKITFLPSVVSRAAMESFADGDQIGIFMVARSDTAQSATMSTTTGNWIDNGRYSYSNSAWTPGTSFYWKDGVSVFDVIAYYPYGYIAAGTKATALSKRTGVNQSLSDSLRLSDFLYGNTPSVSYNKNSKGIDITMKHKFSKLNITLNLDTITAKDIEVTVRNMQTAALIDLNTGSVKADGSTRTITAKYDATTKVAECILVPQTVTSGSDLICVAFTNGSGLYRRLIYTLNSDVTFESGKEYNLTFAYKPSSAIKCSLTIKDLNK
jgi:hypothetical protein